MGGLASDDGLVTAVSKSYIQHLRVEMASCKGHLMPGVRELLPRLRKQKGVHLGLLTGNLEEGARLKLGPFGLNEFSPWELSAGTGRIGTSFCQWLWRG